ncbi:GntR family transcriptional regulator [Salmonella enterica]|nr:GntR family transcriptional regulator [Salmonella enterica]
MKDVMRATKYQAIKDELLNEINQGFFKPGEKFYSESALKERYDVSSATVIRAIHEMVNEGYLVRLQGKGTFISKAKRNETVIYSESDGELKGIQSVKIIGCELKDTLGISPRFDTLNDGSYYRISRLKSDNGKPYALQTSYIPEYYFPQKLTVKNSALSSIYEAFKINHGLDMYIMPYQQTVTALNDTPEDVRAHLSLDTHQPVMLMQRHTYNLQGRIIEYIETYKTLESFCIEIKTPGRGGG